MKLGRPNLSIHTFAIPVIIALAACFQPIVMGYPQGHDWIFELARIVEYKQALSAGQGLPFWAGDLYRGFGSPVFVFYAPLYMACASLLMMLGLPVTTAAITVLVFFAMLAAVGMAGLAREILGRHTPGADSAARVASVVFVLIHKGNKHGLPMLAISFALVVLSALIVPIFHRRFDAFFQTIAAMLIALGLSSWFWLAALGLKEFVRIDEMTQGKFDFHNNFTPVSEMFAYGGLFSVGWFIPAVLLISIVALVRGNKNPILASLFAAGLLLIFLQTSASTLIWENMPMLPLFQFSWRMLGPLYFGGGTHEWPAVSQVSVTPAFQRVVYRGVDRRQCCAVDAAVRTFVGRIPAICRPFT